MKIEREAEELKKRQIKDKRSLMNEERKEKEREKG